jgi:hypothetical protein
MPRVLTPPFTGSPPEVPRPIELGGATPGLEFQGGSAYGISAANEGRLRYEEVSDRFQISENGGAYFAIMTTASTTLQAAYDGGSSIATSLANGDVSISNTVADNENVLTLTKNPAGAQSGDALNVTMGATTTGRGIAVTMTAGSTGLAGLFSGASISCPGAGANSERFGATSLAAGQDSLAVGFLATAPGAFATALGRSSQANARSVAVGMNTNASGTASVVLGQGAGDGFFAAIVIGDNVTATANNQCLIGGQLTPVNNLFVGYGVTAASPPATVTIQSTGGSGAAVTGSALRIGSGVSGDAATAGVSLILATARAGTGTALTTAVTISNTGTISCLGAGATSERFGAGTTATSTNSLAVGNAATATTGTGNIAIGTSASATGAAGGGAIAIGEGASCTGGNLSVVIGDAALGSADQVVSVGGGANVSATGGTAIGWGAAVSGISGSAFGGNATASAGSATAFGNGATASATNSIAFGQSTTASHASSFCWGVGAVTTATNQGVFGSASIPLTSLFFGQGVSSATPSATITWTVTGGSGAAVTGSDWLISGSLAGDAATGGGDLAFAVAIAGTGTTRTTIASILAASGNIELSGDRQFIPAVDDDWSVGTAARRFTLVRAVTITSGDIGFDDAGCSICGRELATDDDLVLRVRDRDPAGTLRRVSYTVPVHAACAGWTRAT